jgi:hypothetical protein
MLLAEQIASASSRPDTITTWFERIFTRQARGALRNMARLGTSGFARLVRLMAHPLLCQFQLLKG